MAGKGSKKPVTVVTVTDEPTLLVGDNTLRKSVTFQNQDDANTVWLGESGVTTDAGVTLAAGDVLSDDESLDAWYGVCDSGLSADVAILEVES